MTTTKLSSNAIYSWWTHPISIESGGNRHYGGVLTNGDWRQFQNAPTTNMVIYSGLEADDHNAPSVIEAPGKDKIAFFTRHGMSQFVNYCKAPNGTVAFGSKTALTFVDNVTYSQVIFKGDRIVLFTRSGSDKWAYVISEDWGVTWSEPQYLLSTAAMGKLYILVSQSETDSDVYHVAAYGHPNESSWTDIAYITLNIATGELRNSTGTLDNIFTPTSLPLVSTDMDVAWTPSGANNPRVRLLDFGDKRGKQFVLYAKWNDVTTEPQYYYGYHNGASWVHTKIIASGGIFGSTEVRKYVGGMALDRGGLNEFYLSRNDGGAWKLQRYLINTDMTVSYSSTRAQSTTPLVRPYCPRNGSGVIYEKLLTYNSFIDYSSELWWSD